MEMIGILNVGYRNVLHGGMVSSGAESATHGVALDLGPGLRYWVHPQFAVGAAAGVRGDFLFAPEGTRAFSVFGAVQILGLF